MKPLCPDILKYIYSYLPLEKLLDISILNKKHRYSDDYNKYYLLRFNAWKLSYTPSYNFSKNHIYYKEKVRFLIGVFLNSLDGNDSRIKFLNIFKKLMILNKKEPCDNYKYCGGYAFTMRIRETLRPICPICDNQ